MIKLINFLTQPMDKRLETLNWRNSEAVVKFFQIKNISLETHKKWLLSMEGAQARTIAFFIEYEGKFVGVTYFHSVNYTDKSADWGIYIHDENMRGKGIGASALKQSLLYAEKELGLQAVFLEVLTNNQAGLCLYEKFGFKKISQKENVLRYKYSFLSEPGFKQECL